MGGAENGDKGQLHVQSTEESDKYEDLKGQYMGAEQGRETRMKTDEAGEVDRV